MRRFLIAILAITAIVISGGLIATTAYQAGLAANIAIVGNGVPEDTTAGDATVVTPVFVPAYVGTGWGWGWHGPGLFGFLAFLFVMFLIFGMIRFLVGGGRRGPWGRGGWSHAHGPGARQTFEDWHRAAHEPVATSTADAGPPDTVH